MIEVEIWSDFACPFCYIGKRSFDLALSNFSSKDDVRVTFKSFELDPHAKKNHFKSIHDYLAKKFGQSTEWARQQNDRVTKMAASVGLEYHMDKIIPTNTFDAHRLSQFAGRKDLQPQMQERLLTAYFKEGKDLGDIATLVSLAVEVGLDRAETEAVLNSDRFKTEVRVDEDEAHAFGVRGVPFFIFNRELAVSGAQPTDVFTEALSSLAAVK